jgi:hypothetical protein
MAMVGVLILASLMIMVPTGASDGGNSTRGADILVVQDGPIAGSSGESILLVLQALSMGGFSWQYVPSEAALPGGWDDPNNYPSIFWICGDYYTKPAGYEWYSNVPTSTNCGKLTAYVQKGGNVMVTGNAASYTGHYSGSTEIPFYNWVLHHYWGNQWGGGGFGYNDMTYIDYVSDVTHELFNNPNLIPSSFSYSYLPRVCLWGSPGGTLNNGQLLMTTRTTWSTRLWDCMVVWDGHEYGPYGRTVFLNKRLCYQYDMTNYGDMLTPFVQNVATWFGEPGIPADVRLEPQSLNLDSNGNYVQVKVEGFPENPEYSPMDVDGTSVAVSGVGVDLKYGTWNDNRWIGKADRLMVEDAIGTPGDEVEVGVNGNLNDGTVFIGKAVIKVLQN